MKLAAKEYIYVPFSEITKLLSEQPDSIIGPAYGNIKLLADQINKFGPVSRKDEITFLRTKYHEGVYI